MNYIFSAGLWGTTLTEDTTNNREQFMRTTLRELLVYLVFLVDLCLRECTVNNADMHVLKGFQNSN